ncbi:MAG: hypothetical protein EPO09_12315 [Aquabacterium sp.]|uniref:alkaline phosphatase D family protein n=1 Tax=Aquabacterium sp. TaxID=1872578 RepID=UPI00121B01CF|nr:alkaline phosphatase D family protein [Aquabacterium sp.]TAK93536.1 MAG: hypothetical protein EPO09_12315 [Aquabacterium sp.]
MSPSPKAPPFGAVRISPPQYSDTHVTTDDTGQATVILRLGFESQFGHPLFAGIIPAPYIGLPLACAKARYAVWTGNGRLPISDFAVDVDWANESPCADWLAYVVYGQPRDFDEKGLEHFTQQQVFTKLEGAASRFRELEGTYAHSQDAIDDIVRAVRAAERETLIGPGHLTLKLPHLRDVPPELITPPEGMWHTQETASFHVNSELTHTKAPAPDALPTRFLLTSCLYPGGLLDRTPQLVNATSPSERTLSLIAQAYACSASRPDFMLMLGDQVYVDATAGLFDPQLSDGRHSDPYIQWQRSSCVRGLVSEARIEAMIDDHELADNWSPIAKDAPSLLDDGSAGRASDYVDRLKHDGLASYRAYRFNRSRTAGTDGLHGPIGPDHQPALVFMANTRTEREVRNSLNIDKARIMSAPQWADLVNWLQAAPKDAWRYLACPSMVLPRRIDACGATPASALQSDAWDGYPSSLYNLLAAICDLALNKLVLLSGDEHLASISRITLSRAATDEAPAVDTVIHSVHAPALYAPYPFANAKPDNFSQRPFSFTPSSVVSGTSTPAYHCRVETWFPEMGDGFITIDSPPEDLPGQALRISLVCSDPQRTTADMPDWLKQAAPLSIQIDKPSTSTIIAG